MYSGTNMAYSEQQTKYQSVSSPIEIICSSVIKREHWRGINVTKDANATNLMDKCGILRTITRNMCHSLIAPSQSDKGTWPIDRETIVSYIVGIYSPPLNRQWHQSNRNLSTGVNDQNKGWNSPRLKYRMFFQLGRPTTPSNKNKWRSILCCPENQWPRNACLKQYEPMTILKTAAQVNTFLIIMAVLNTYDK